MPAFKPRIFNFKIEPALVIANLRALLFGHSLFHVVRVGSLTPQAYSLIHTVGPLQAQRGNDAARHFLAVEETLKEIRL